MKKKLALMSLAFISLSLSAENVGEVTLTDGESYSVTQEQTCTSVKYVRDFNNTYWQCLYVPFETKVADWQDAQVAQITEFVLVGSNIVKANAKILTGQEVIKANPALYLIKADNTGKHTFTFTNVTLPSKEDLGIVEEINNGVVEELIGGVYEETIKTLPVTIYGNYSQGFTLDASGKEMPCCYSMAGGKLTRGKIVEEKVTLKPYRWAVQFTDIQAQPAKGMNCIIEFVDEITGISTVESSDFFYGENAPIYTVNGQRVADMTRSGLYIQNGKKYMVK